MLNTVSSSVFTSADSISMTPVVSAEWNNNLYCPPYVVTSGNGAFDPLEFVYHAGATLTTLSSGNEYKKDGFTTYSFELDSIAASHVTFRFSDIIGAGESYKVIMYAKTDSLYPVLLNTHVVGYGSKSKEIDSLSWTKIELYCGWDTEITPSHLDFKIVANNIITYNDDTNVYITAPEIYKISRFDYENGSLYSAYAPFKYFRPGESFVVTGNNNLTYPTNFRRVTKGLKNGQSYQEMPVNPLTYNPKFFFASPPVAVYKSGISNDINPYQYFLSDVDNKQITAKYEKTVYTNKIVIKFNNIMATPTVTVSLDGSSIGSYIPNSNGVLILYYDGSSWSTTRWTTMPKFSETGNVTPTMDTFTKISVEQTSETLNSGFSDSKYTSVVDEMERLSLIELSPRIELDLSDFVQDVNINKTLDSGSSTVPISSINSNDASVTLSGIPVTTSSGPLPIFSNESNLSNTFLQKMLTKNVKFYITYLMSDYKASTINTTDYYIPAGVFYSESWEENDIDSINIQLFDSTRYLQTAQAPDYVANMKSVFDIITNILDMAGFTDYDYDSLYEICNDPSLPLDLAYYYCNSQDSTLMAALADIFLAYQIGAYIDEYGVMKFLSLNNILKKTSADIQLDDNDIVAGGYSFNVESKPGKLSLRYQPPKIKQSLSLQNANEIGPKISPSFIYTTSNDVVWSQQNLDSVGFNYLNASMGSNDSLFTLNNNDLLDIFHTFSLNNNGYAAIEDEIVSFVYKEYTIQTPAISPEFTETVAVKNDIELAAEINRFIRKYPVTNRETSATITDIAANGTDIIFTANNSFRTGDRVAITNVVPYQFNLRGEITAATSTTFTIKDTTTGTFVLQTPNNAKATIAADYDIKITPTGNIVNVERGAFNTKVSDHDILTTDISEKSLSDNASGVSLVSVSGNKILVKAATAQDRVLVYPTTDRDSGDVTDTITDKYLGYQTYMTKFDFANANICGVGLFFNRESASETENSYYVEIIRSFKKKVNKKTYYNYYCAVYYYNSLNVKTMIAYSNITSIMNDIIQRFPKVFYKVPGSKPIKYKKNTEITTPFMLKVTHYPEDSILGNTTSDTQRVIRVFINNVEVTAWQVNLYNESATITDAEVVSDTIVYTANNTFSEGDTVSITGITPDEFNFPDGVTITSATSTTFTITDSTETASLYESGGAAINIDLVSGSNYTAIGINPNTSLRKNITIPTQISENTLYGAYATVNPVTIASSISYPTSQTADVCKFTEIYATQSELKDHGINYYYQDKRFLDAVLQGRNNNEKSFCAQTKPYVVGINYYDVQYTTPAAVSVDVLPIEYLWHYFPGDKPEDQKWFQTQEVNEHHLAYSTPINTGFRAKMMIVNNANHMVFLNKDSDELNQFTIRLNLWTHEIVAQSDQEIIEKIIDPSNALEVAQIDSEWIQSRQAANRMLSLVNAAVDGFSKNTSIEIYGNPLIQVGDVVELTYTLKGINQQKYVVVGVEQSFSNGLSTQLELKTLKQGTSYSI